MSIFTGNEILFFLTGALAVILVWLMVILNKRYRFKWSSWVLAIAGCFMLIFAVQWAVSSTLEGEPQAANMGLLLFGVPAVVMLGGVAKLVLKGRKLEASE